MSRVVVLGSLMQDLVVRAPRLPREGETVFGASFAMFTGGKGGNQAIAAARLGAQHVAMIGRVGDDAFAEGILVTLREASIDVTHVTRDAEAGTGIAIPIVLDGGQNSIVSVPRANLGMTAAQVEAARRLIEAAHVLVLQFEVSWEANMAAARIARRAGVPLLLNAAPAGEPPRELLAQAAWLVVNEAEADALAPGEEDRASQAARLRGLCPGVVTITLGGEGAVTASDSAMVNTPPVEVEAVDTVGAGDAFCGALAVAMAEGVGLEAALRFGAAAGGLAATRRGAAASLPARHEVERLLNSGTFSPS